MSSGKIAGIPLNQYNRIRRATNKILREPTELSTGEPGNDGAIEPAMVVMLLEDITKCNQVVEAVRLKPIPQNTLGLTIELSGIGLVSEMSLVHEDVTTDKIPIRATAEQLYANLQQLPQWKNFEPVVSGGTRLGRDLKTQYNPARWFLNYKDWPNKETSPQSPPIFSGNPYSQEAEILVYETMWMATDHIIPVRGMHYIPQVTVYAAGSICIVNYFDDGDNGGWLITVCEPRKYFYPLPAIITVM